MKSITIDEAVARMVNIEHIPPGMNLVDCMDALVEEAEKAHKDAEKKGLPLDLFETRIKAANARFELAAYLKQHIEWELGTPDCPTLLRKSSESSSHIRLEVDSVTKWADHHYMIGRIDYEELHDATIEKPIGNAEKEAIKISQNGLSPKLAERLYITFAFLLEAFIEAKKNPIGFGTPEDINVRQTVELLIDRVSAFKNSTKFYDKEILKDRVEIAIAMKKLFGKN